LTEEDTCTVLHTNPTDQHVWYPSCFVSEQPSWAAGYQRLPGYTHLQYFYCM